MLRQVITPALRCYSRRPATGAVMRYSSHRGPTMDDLPLPSGSWESVNKSNQQKYNMHLAMGVLFSIITVIVAKSSGLLYLNYDPPKFPKEK